MNGLRVWIIAHAGVLVLTSLLYYTFMDKTSMSPAVKHAALGPLRRFQD